MKKGFSLVELIVAFGVFTIVAFIAVSGLLAIVSVQTDAETGREAIDSMEFAFNDLVRAASLGRNYNCGPVEDISGNVVLCTNGEPGNPSGCITELGLSQPQDCSPDGNSQYFMYEPHVNQAGYDEDNDGELDPGDENLIGDQIVYKLDVDDTTGYGRLLKSVTGYLTDTDGTVSSEFVPITHPDINITNFEVEVTGSNNNDREPARARVSLVGVLEEGTEFQKVIPMQTSFIQRTTDL